MKSIQVNPFIIGAYAGSHYFCDCERETDELVQDLTNGRNVVLVAQRRMGKTGLILHTFHQEKISKHYNVFFIDIFATASIREFVYAFGNAIIDQLKPRGRKFLDRFFANHNFFAPCCVHRYNIARTHASSLPIASPACCWICLTVPTVLSIRAPA